ncbi:hypothetical protein ASG56_13510 [Rhodococcus sp. Leaf7]|uniref:hypothetical protein n=1 Tax=unclassified Rhodococcus (in: high G+C Gram-positive bacteria) TaxID=192944 RepID=UPI000700A59B|nr:MULTISPECIES: hypothetical protein [unclassified Rhodococcus (in: high G+C Gram-positive bacteria)]KQU04373.1 hypothetical protein ASG56_13510 [Rhodococcus sp. Leaf7]KQU40558.1 hypothetical protein ASG64_13500 [Rhodococcus sp. Leaf247]
MPGTSTDALASAVEQLTRQCDDEELRRVVATWGSPVTAGVSGRAGVGKSALVEQLDGVQEVRGVDTPGAADPVLDQDVLVHVVARTVTPADRRALSSRAGLDTLVVAGRLDLETDPRAYVASLSVDVPVVPADDVTAVRHWCVDARERARRRRDTTLLRDLERVAAARPDTRPAVETFLRSAAASTLRNGS